MNAISHAKDELMSPDQMELEAGGDYNARELPMYTGSIRRH